MQALPSLLAASRPDPWLLAADLLDPPALEQGSRWYCDRAGCDGEPHEGWHWCEHALDGAHEWTCRHARANQRPPGGEWRIWLLMAGRGFGKTRSGAEWLAHQAERSPNTTWAVVAPTRDIVKQVCFEGESGLLRALGTTRTDPGYNKADLLFRLANGSVINSYSAETPRSARGPNYAGAWLEELAQWKYRAAWDDLLPALRRGKAQVVATTTPAAVPLVREFVDRDDGSVVVTRGSTFDNRANLSEAAVLELEHRWKGTRRERQELYGELLEDVPGALWTPSLIEQTRGVLID